ncbi:hypothetical protein [Paractinoplanes durhamensis]|nr:hypothetical protein [Actinoplanes durhamensis]
MRSSLRTRCRFAGHDLLAAVVVAVLIGGRTAQQPVAGLQRR